MPICDNRNKNTPIITKATDVNHEAAEIAKVKISREQAYFNSYNFDAIEELPLDSAVGVLDQPVRNCDSSNSRNNTPDTVVIIDDIIEDKCSGDRDFAFDVRYQPTSGAYVKRLTSYFQATLPSKSRQATLQYRVAKPVTIDTASSEDNFANQSEGSVSSGSLSGKYHSAEGNELNSVSAKNNFSLPRAMLKSPSKIVGGAGSMSDSDPTAAAPNKMCNLTSIYHSSNDSTPCCEKSDGRSRERVTSTSHYSTDKSASSGYYSSRVCSTSSVEEHIYSEPVIDIVHTRLVPPPLKQLTLPLEKTLEKHKDPDSILENDAKEYYNVTIDGESRISEELRSLEDSIKNLDRHLKTYSGLSRSTLNRLSELSLPRSNESPVYDDVTTTLPIDRTKNALPMPTIMEGNDGGPGSLKTPPSWSDDVEDSLTDIDLDSFRLVNEIGRTSMRTSKHRKAFGGIDNPTFDKTKVLDAEVLENNYKCSKYVNSCPEDAYKVESVIESLGNQDVMQRGNQEKTLGFFLKRYEDQIHFQSTKDMLEDIQTKVNALTTLGQTNSGDSQIDGGHFQTNLSLTFPKDLEHYIAILKQELETYLSLMNQSNELEIKQLCLSLVNNQKLLTITKAFERRKSMASYISSTLSYEVLRPSNYTTSPYIAGQERLHGGHSTIALSDPNFHLKRKTMLEDNDTVGHQLSCEKHVKIPLGKQSESGRQHLNGRNPSWSPSGSTQLQKNLSLQRPMLDKRNVKISGGDITNDKDSMLDWHRNKPSIWEQYYGTNRINQTLTGKRGQLMKNASSILSYPSSRPESDFTLDLPRAEQLRIKMDKEKKFRQRCRILTTFLSLVFFLLTVMVVSLILTRGKRMFGSML